MSHRTPVTHPDLVVTRTQAPFKERVLYCVGGIAPQVNLRVNNPDIGTLETALCTRMYTCEVEGEFVAPPQPDPRMVATKLADFKTKLVNFTSTPETHEQVVEQYVGRKKAVYQNACDSLGATPVNARDAVSVAFVKPEKVPPNKAPRCIQPRDPRYNLSLGRYIKHVEHRLYKRIAKIYGDGPTVMKGYNVEGVARIAAAKWHSFADPVAVGLDATKFDMHVSPAMLAWEHSIYTAIFPNDAHLRKLLRWQMHNEGRGYCGDGKLKYKVRGKRFSGDMNTALGNCLIMCAMVHQYLTERNVVGKLINNGDDCVVFMERCDLERFQQGLEPWFLELGFRMVAEAPVYNLCQVEFCQMHPIKTVNGWTMVRNIPKALAKDAMCLLPLRNSKEMREWLGAVGLCGTSITHGVPVLSAFYQRYAQLGTTNTKFGETLMMNSGVRFLAQGVVGVEDTITPEARDMVWLAWGILPDLQVALEEQFHHMQIEYGGEVVGGWDNVPCLTM